VVAAVVLVSHLLPMLLSPQQQQQLMLVSGPLLMILAVGTVNTVGAPLVGAAAVLSMLARTVSVP
jgi:hypothetical protein